MLLGVARWGSKLQKEYKTGLQGAERHSSTTEVQKTSPRQPGINQSASSNYQRMKIQSVLLLFSLVGVLLASSLNGDNSEKEDSAMEKSENGAVKAIAEDEASRMYI
ncbi:hypothetical protein J4Q44_G00283480 [Coregonus suidteri]|uniref:Uncharacterized protein n=1 Tax=Coregonus suidteri TaxID=861788 RepID=A0AAN8L7T3_9TELE